MPNMDKSTATEIIREIGYTAPVISITGKFGTILSKFCIYFMYFKTSYKKKSFSRKSIISCISNIYTHSLTLSLSLTHSLSLTLSLSLFFPLTF